MLAFGEEFFENAIVEDDACITGFDSNRLNGL
jgi:hypothetical protein